MKTTITILLLLITLISKSQNYPKLPIWELEKDTVNIGDSVYVGFKIVPPAITTNTYCAFQIQYPNFDIIWSGNYNNLYNLPTYQIGSNTVYKMYLRIPSYASLGNNKIYSSGGYSIDIYIKDNVTKLIEYSNNSVIDVKYYDIYGKEKPSKEGLTIMITTYSNGYQKREKVIIQP